MRRVHLGLAAAASLLALASCQAFVSTEPGAGVGSSCRKDTDCQASECISGVCAIRCEPDGDECPEGTTCTAANLCQLPYRVASFYPGGKSQDWTVSHDLGFLGASKVLPYLTQVQTTSDVASADDAAAKAGDAVKQGFNAIFAANPDWNAAIIGVAQQNPAVQFFTAGGGGGPSNHHGYFGRLYKAWYLAGAAAATVSPSPDGRLGIVGSFVTPSVVRHINAFVRGAQSVYPNIVAEVQWMHEWVSTPTSAAKDTDLAHALVENGATVISYHGYNRFAATTALGEPSAPWVIGNNLLRGADEEVWCDAAKCLGTVYWNWAPLYRRLIDQAHSAELGPGAGANDNIQVDPEQSVPNFAVNEPSVQEATATLLNELAKDGGVGLPFAGPITFTDGSTVEAGVTLNDGDLGSMCRFVVGVVEKDGDGMDQPALVPVEGGCTPPDQ